MLRTFITLQPLMCSAEKTLLPSNVLVLLKLTSGIPNVRRVIKGDKRFLCGSIKPKEC